MKEPLLYLCHRMPFPPNKGDKITTFNILKFLSEHYDVYLATFIDDPKDKQYCDLVASYCKESIFINLNPTLSKIKGLGALLRNEPITLPYYRSTPMQRWVSGNVAKHHIQKAFIYSACMAQYVLKESIKDIYKIMQFADIDSDKWRQFACSQNAIMNKIYLREHRMLFAYEKYVAEQFNLSCFISDAEVSLFKSMISANIHKKIKTLSNGIDSQFFSNAAQANLTEEYDLKSDNYVVFTGAMDYLPNVETVSWFIQHVWLEVINAIPNGKFYIVGSSPLKRVLNLAKYPGVIVTGRVDDIRPYLSNAKAAVAPMQMGRGIQNKILEAMAMELPVLTTKLGAEGLEDYTSKSLYITDAKEEMRQWVKEKLCNPPTLATESRQWLLQHYSWNAKLSPLLDFLQA